MDIQFPGDFIWGCSTAAAQIETASDHNWKGLQSRDGHIFDRTTDHEKRRDQDIEYIARFGQVYRCSVDWARLQPAPFALFDEKVVAEYRSFFQQLNFMGIKVMLVLHHFSHPRWFEEAGAWLYEENINSYMDYVRQCTENFTEYISYWNTFNEPNVYAMNAYLLGNFPPKKKNRFTAANRVLNNMEIAHKVAYHFIKEKDNSDQVGISVNTAWMQGKNLPGIVLAFLSSYWFHHPGKDFFEVADFIGISYYAYVPFKPFPITEIDNPGKLEKLKIPHDRMWGYRPEGLGRAIRSFYKRYKKPVIITENGICTEDPEKRILAIRDYLRIIHQEIRNNIPVKGYFHWSAWDNFEWNLGPTYRFGLVHVDFDTMERSSTDAATYFSAIVKNNGFNEKLKED